MVDLIEHRYGWTDEVVFNLPYARFLEVAETAARQVVEREREQYRQMAFGAYLRAGLEGVSFQQYLDALDLGYGEPKPKEKELTKEEAIDKAYDIMARMQSKK